MTTLYLLTLSLITWSDLTEHTIPDEWILAGFLIRFVQGVGLSPTWAVISTGFALLGLAGLGWGDVKLAALLYMTGRDIVLRIMLAFLTASLFGFFALSTRGATRKSHLPMAPFLIGCELFFL